MQTIAEMVTKAIGAPMHYQDGPVRDGITVVLAVGPNARAIWPREYNTPYVDVVESSINVGRMLAKHVGETECIARFPGSGMKIVTIGFGDFWVGVMVESGHIVNKSLHRIISRACRRCDLGDVKSSKSCEDLGQHNGQSVLSSVTPEAGISSPSLEERTGPTGGSQDEESKKAASDPNCPLKP